MRVRLQNLSGNLKSLRDITEHERQKLADDGSLNRAIEAFNREVDQMTAEDQSLLKEQQAIGKMHYDLCPNKASYEECTHGDRKQQWNSDRNARQTSLKQRRDVLNQRKEKARQLWRSLKRKIAERSAFQRQEKDKLQKEEAAKRHKLGEELKPWFQPSQPSSP